MKYSEYEEMKAAKDQDVPTGEFNYEEHEEKKKKALRMKLIIGTVITMVLFVVIIWCVSQSDANKKVRTTQTEEEKSVVIETTTQNTDSTYSFVTEENGYRYLTVTPQEFVANYNKAIVGKGENGKTYDITLDDFQFVRSSTWNGRKTNYYACNLTIFGRNEGIVITLEIYDDDNTIAATQLLVANHYIYESNAAYIDGFSAQYAYLMVGLGISEDEAADILYNLAYNEDTYKNYSLYKKGLAFGFNKDEIGMGMYRILPCTEEIAEQYGYGDVVS